MTSTTSNESSPLPEVRINLVTSTEFSFLQHSDKNLNEVINYQKIDRWPTLIPDELRKFERLRGNLVIGENDILGINKNGFSWAAPVLLVKKANGKWRLVCDYRKLNSVTIANQYPLPEIDGLMISHLSTRWQTQRLFADLFTGFHQIPCDEETKQKIAIATDFGQFTWTAMPMGGKNA